MRTRRRPDPQARSLVSQIPIRRKQTNDSTKALTGAGFALTLLAPLAIAQTEFDNPTRLAASMQLSTEPAAHMRKPTFVASSLKDMRLGRQDVPEKNVAAG